MIPELFLECIAAFFGTVAFCILFHAPIREYLVCGLTGVLGWLVYALLVIDFSQTVASFAATVVIALAARFFAVWRKVPSNMFIFSGIFPIIPGTGIYNTIYQLIEGNGQEAFSTGIATFKVVVAIVLGIVVAFLLPHSFFRKLRRS